MLTLLFFALSESTIAKLPDESDTTLSAVPENTTLIPFELIGHKIYVRVQINDNPQKYRFLLDTGALTMIDEKVAEELRLERSADRPTLNPSVQTYMTILNRIRLNEMEAENMSIPIMNTVSVFGASFEADGFIGSDFLKFFRFTIDYRKKHILYNGIADFSDSTYTGHRIQFDRHFMIGAPMVECTINGAIQTTGMIDTGSPFGLVLPLSFAERIGSSTKIQSRGVMAEWPFTSSEYNSLARIEHLTLGTLVLQNIPVLLAELPANLSGPLIGKEFLSQFLVTLDYPENELILLPYDDAQFKDNLFSTGLALVKDENNRTVVRGFWEGSPAHRAGVQVGDEILEINSERTKDLSREEIDEILDADSIHKIEFIVRIDETEMSIILKKELLLPAIN